MSATITDEIQKKLQEKGLSDTSIKQYLMVLRNLNNKQPIKNLLFLRDTEAITAKLNEYAFSTRHGILGGINSVLNLYATKNGWYKKASKYYSDLLSKVAEERKAMPKNVMTDKEEKNWIKWEEVLEKRNALKDAVLKFIHKESLSTDNYDTLLQLVVLSLYTYMPPRRNDYLYTYITKKWTKENNESTKNYYDVASERFIFNRFKTAKKEGQQIVDIPDDDEDEKFGLVDILELYMKHHPKLNGGLPITPVKLLVQHNGADITTVNAITRILNKIFGRNIGSSALRHIYLTNKYGDTLKEMTEDARAMAHSVDMARQYIKFDKDEESEED